MGDEVVIGGKAGAQGEAGDGGIAGDDGKSVEIPELSEGSWVHRGVVEGEVGAAGLDRGKRRSSLSSPQSCTSSTVLRLLLSSLPMVILAPLKRLVLLVRVLAEEGLAAEGSEVEGSVEARFRWLIRWWSNHQNFHPQ
jgi:hypothetical protein